VVSRTAVLAAQKTVASIAFALHRPFARRRPVTWLVGVHELASMVIQLGQALPGSITVVDRPHAFYGERYDAVIERPPGGLNSLRNLLFGPWIFGATAARARGVVYVGERGFLNAARDEREWEFRFLRRRGRHCVVVFTGNDIRSPRLMAEHAAETGFDNIGAILLRQGAPYDTDAYDSARRRRAAVCDRYASAVYTAPVDQLSHLTMETLPFPYLYPDANFAHDHGKFDDVGEIRVVHAPSNPTLKGTPAVRAAMERITERFPNVRYIELTDVGNEEVRRILSQAHIVLNQFHAYMPGVFGIEALAHRCVMVCSADPVQEPAIADAHGAWVIATAETLSERLTELLEDPASLAAQADRGYEWARAHASETGRGVTLRAELSSL
jgi:hypothetical protein